MRLLSLRYRVRFRGRTIIFGSEYGCFLCLMCIYLQKQALISLNQDVVVIFEILNNLLLT